MKCIFVTVAIEHSRNAELISNITLTEWGLLRKLCIVALTVKVMILKKQSNVNDAANMLPKLTRAYVKFAMVICMASKRSKACDISPKVRQEVLDRDNHQCIICGVKQGLQIAHYISRARLGLGIARNLGAMCIHCHREYDNGNLHREIKKAFKDYLKAHYEDWNEKDLIYKKWSF